MKELKLEHEIENSIKFSRKYLLDYIEEQLKVESKQSPDADIAKAWERKCNHPGLTCYVKKGGSHLSAGQPFIRGEMTFGKGYDMYLIAKCLYDLSEI